MPYKTLLLSLLFIHSAIAQKMVPVGEGWAGNSINTVVFRKNSVVSFKDHQYAAYYDSSGHVVLAKRKLNNNKWEIQQTKLTGNIRDAHNSISIIVDGDDYLHIAWNHHGNALHYTKSIEPGSLEMMKEQSMTGKDEAKVTYPEFYKLSNGDVLFLYRDGASGNGNLILNRYSLKTKSWERVNSNLIDGEGKRNAYWQACVDEKGTFHISWVWRESPDVATNHDLCYAKSRDGGKTWTQSNNKIYILPINAANAEYIVRIPQNNELINSTGMSTDEDGEPFIATYWRPAGTKIPQYHLIYHDGRKWIIEKVSNRKIAFSLSGAGTKKIPIARPQVVVKGREAYIIFRDAERGDKVSIIMSRAVGIWEWKTINLSDNSVGQWEPSYDTELWKKKKILHLFVQLTGQGDGERLENIPPQMVSILEWVPDTNYE